MAAASLLLSCRQEKVPSTSEYGYITFSASADEAVPSTKALLTNTTLKTNGNRIQVLDILSDFTGTASWMGSDGLYVNDEIVYSGTTVWDYYSTRVYPWTSDGDHQFFAWLSYDTTLDVTADSFFGETLTSDFSSTDRKLNLPALEMNTSSDQFDFMYANTSIYPMPRTSTDPVALNMQHLFSALSIQLRNESQDTILVTGVTIEGLKNKKSAVIAIPSTVTYTEQTASAEFVNNSFSSQTLAYGDKYDLLASSKNTTAEYRLIWPQTEDDLAPSDANNYTTYPITVYYQYVSDTEHILHTAHLRFPEGASFEAGVRYSYTLLFTQKHVQLNFTVNPWNYNSYDWSFDKQTISETDALNFKSNEGYTSGSTCNIVNGTAVTGKFKITNPSGAVWAIEPLGDVDYFTISPNQGMVDSANPWWEIQVIPNLDSSLDRTEDKKLRFHFTVTFTNGDVHDADSELNYDDWVIVLPKN